MKRTTGILSCMALCCAAGLASAQQPGTTPAVPPPKPTAQSEAGEPRADTSGPAAAGPAPAAKSPAAAPKSAGVAAKSSAATAPKSAAKTDRLELGTATVTGDREQPKVMYIVPWKKSDIGDLTGKPMNSLVDEILAPVDRDVFKREVVYYGAVQAEASQNGALPKPVH
jgi:hypothetical protein